jgi:tyrosine-protein kinase Etk/Wzc
MTTPAEQYSGAQLMRSGPMLPQPIQRPAPYPPPDEAQVELKSYFNVLLDQRWLILGIALLLTLLATLYALIAKPVYEANMLIHVEEVNPNASKNILNEVSSMFETKKAAIAEMELLRSRMVIAPAVEKLRLYIDAQPRRFPLPLPRWGDAAERPLLSTPGIFGLGGYTWGDEAIEVSAFNVPPQLQDRDFVLTVGPQQQFRLREERSGVVLDGTAGGAQAWRTSFGPVELSIDRLAALPGAEFTVRRSSVLRAIEQVQNALQISEQGKQSGVIEVRLQGHNALLVNRILTELGREYMRQNLARKTEEAEKSLSFLNQQLPELKRQLEKSESEYNLFRNRHGTVDLTEEAKISLQQSAAAKTRRIELMQKRTELLTRFTDEHPILVGINRQINEVNDEIKAVADHIRTLPLLEQEAVRLTRDIKVNTDLYTALSNTAQQLRIVSVGKVSNVRLVDLPMVPERPLKPNRPLIIGAAAAAGLILGMLAAFMRHALFGGIDDPNKIEKMLGSRVVYATIPHSANQDRLARHAKAHAERMPVLANVLPEDAAIEALRGFRAAMQFSMPHFRNNIVMLTGPSQGLGKSFVSVNFAAVMAASGKRVLLIDADLRNGYLHRYFGSGRQQGLSDAITGAMRVDQIIRRGVMDNLDFIPTGALPPNRAEFLMHLNFGAMLEAVRGQYDLVLIDPPPILAVADALVIGAHAGAVFIVVRAGLSTEGEINESIKRLNQAGISPQGVLFNDLPLRLGGYGYPYRYSSLSQIGHAGA